MIIAHWTLRISLEVSDENLLTYIMRLCCLTANYICTRSTKRLTKIFSRKWGLFFNIISFVVLTCLLSVLLCWILLIKKKKKSHQQQIWHDHMNFSTHPCSWQSYNLVSDEQKNSVMVTWSISEIIYLWIFFTGSLHYLISFFLSFSPFSFTFYTSVLSLLSLTLYSVSFFQFLFFSSLYFLHFLSLLSYVYSSEMKEFQSCIINFLPWLMPPSWTYRQAEIQIHI